MNHSKDTRRQRAIDLRAFLARHAHLFTLKDVCGKAGVNYDSTVNNIRTLIVDENVYAMSDARLDALEEAAIALSETKMEKKTA